MRVFRIFIAVILSLIPAAQALPFNSNVSEEELESALNGEILVRNISSYKKISLESDNPDINNCLYDLKELNPKYFVEVIHIRKALPEDKIVEKLFTVLSDVEKYTEIPYHSVRHNTVTPLYSYCEILSESEKDNDVYAFTAAMTMPPFELYTADISIKTDRENFLLYNSKNIDDMECVGFVRVKKDNLRSVVTVFQYDGYWIIYGIGAAKAPKVPLLTNRIETAFISRVRAFCGYAVKLLDSHF